MSDQPPPTDTATVHLRILGEDTTFELEVPLGKRTLGDLLPSARELSAEATKVAVAQVRSQGRAISCRAGCGACCRQLVAVSVVEAHALAKLVASWPEPRREHVRRRFHEALVGLEAAGFLDADARRGDRTLMVPGTQTPKEAVAEVGKRYFPLGIPCPFLEDEACGIHDQRPMVCREYHVTSPADHCTELFLQRVEKVEPPLHMSAVMARVADRVAGVGSGKTIPLVLALEWSETHGQRLERPHDGLNMFKAMLTLADPEHERPFDRR